jgi:hypothetical protein
MRDTTNKVMVILLALFVVVLWKLSLSGWVDTVWDFANKWNP